MCGRVLQSSAPIRYGIVDGTNVRDSRAYTTTRRAGVARRAKIFVVIRRNRLTGDVSLDPLRWGLIPYWCQDPRGGSKPINATTRQVCGNVFYDGLKRCRARSCRWIGCGSRWNGRAGKRLDIQNRNGTRLDIKRIQRHRGKGCQICRRLHPAQKMIEAMHGTSSLSCTFRR